MENCCTPGCIGAKLLVMGLVLILVRIYTQWDIWVVLGVILIIKAVMMFIMPVCACNRDSKAKRKR